jgi:hypothetical protein
MNLIFLTSLYTFPMMFFFGVNVHAKPQASVNFRESAEACGTRQ